MFEKHERPWGYYENLSEQDGYKVKRLTVYPLKRLSLQSHEHRSETWITTSGFGLAEIDYISHDLFPSKVVEIPKRSIHRICNISKNDNLVIIEVQLGDILSEEDIKRFQDDFGRAK